MLNHLQKQELASYLPRTDSPQLSFLQSRVDYKNLHIDTAFIAARKQVREQQIKSIYTYLDGKECRSIAMNIISKNTPETRFVNNAIFVCAT